MAHVVLMPKAGQSMIEGRIVSWLKKEGDKISKGDPLFEVETDKANVEVEALQSGVLRKIFVAEGATSGVLTAVALIADANENVDIEALRAETNAQAAKSTDAAGADSSTSTGAKSRAPAARAAASPAGQRGPAAAPPRAPASRPQVVPARTTSGSTQVSSNSAARPAAALAPSTRAATTAAALYSPPNDAHGRRIAASPLARRVAESLGVDLRAVRGTGPGGRILRRDIENAPTASPSRARGSSARGATTDTGAGPLRERPRPEPAPAEPEFVPLVGMRLAIARALEQSKRTIPHFYVTQAIDITASLALKTDLAESGIKITVNDLVLRAVTLALADEPRMNCRVSADRIEYPSDINLGIAVGSEGGLVVPVLLRAHELDLVGIAEQSRLVIAAAQGGKLVGAGQGTFTISNLGMFGVESFAAIINPPEGAILAVGGAREELVPHARGISPRSILRVTLSCDHRAIDGMIAARFLSRLAWFLENAEL
jgi:pyruvate dehydrogenase E2 component (dihydrolipoamide acetyltransferase)